ncbi:hypothetical protein Verru16b_00725 [Lacunisphaera limnophila]|uniref:VWFA domain-containing protein n=1 Tax=Lacunisphaera limnophila TaxID=1838286 RepID=A0A1D8ARZ5_9BACT|nr:hypothetical protein [Lacunisphaera limnophila]AOS43673.1 hypothetical protein Verru16b_00725 [Lacunisphaera limnophila]
MIRRSSVPIFSLSFLDCICCGFGAIILLFVLTMGSETKVVQELRERLQRIVEQQLVTLAELRRSQDEILITQARASVSTIALQEKESLKQLLARLEQQVADQKAARDRLLVDVEEVKTDLAARQKPKEIALSVDPAPIGLPAESNHVAFIIDSSGSMRDPSSERIWPIVLKKFDEVLNAYPDVKGIQFLDADGRFIISGRQAEQTWLPDNAATRNAIKSALFDYDIFSNSNPVPGIVRALRTLLDENDPEMRMTIFILGDEFTGTADAVLRRLDELNPRNEQGKRRVVINAIGFPTAVKMGFSMGNTGVKYANLMREVTFQHGGAFIALQEIEEREERPRDRERPER